MKPETFGAEESHAFTSTDIKFIFAEGLDTHYIEQSARKGNKNHQEVLGKDVCSCN